MRLLVVEDEKQGARFITKAWALRAMGAEVVVGHLLVRDAMHRVMAGGETMDFGRSVPDAYLAATVKAAAVAKHHGVQAFIHMSQIALAQMRMTENHREPAAHAALARRAGAELVRPAGRARAADRASRRLLPDVHCGFGQGITSDQTTVRRGQDFAGRRGRRGPCDRRAARQSAATPRQDRSPGPCQPSMHRGDSACPCPPGTWRRP